MKSNEKVLIIAVAIVMMASVIVVGTSSSGDSGGGLTISDVEYTSGSVMFSGTSQDADAVKFFVTYPNGKNSQYGTVAVLDGLYSGTMKLDLPIGDYVLTVFTSSTVKATESFSVSDSQTAGVALNKHSATITAESSETLRATLVQTGSSVVTWTSSNPLIVSVDNGKLTAKAYGTAVITATSGAYSDSCSVTVEYASLQLSSSSMSLMTGSSGQLSVAVPTGYSASSATWRASSSLIEITGNGSSVTITAGFEAGDDMVTVIIGNLYSASCPVTVTAKPAVDNVYYFEIRMDVDADKVRHSVYTQSMLESGFTIQATAKNAAEALEKVCKEKDIPLVQHSDATLKGWVTSMFELGDVNLGNGEWKYWIQYYEGSYNNYTLGYYTNGGHFQLVYGTTKLTVSIEGAPTGSIEIGSSTTLKAMISPDGREPGAGETVVWSSSNGSVATVSSSGIVTAVGVGTATITVKVNYGASKALEDSVTITVVENGRGPDGPDRKEETTEKTNTDGSKETTTTVTTKDKEGNEVKETTTTKENLDGSKAETETNTVTKADGSGSTTTKTETEYDASGKVTGKTETVTETSVVKNKDGTTSETTSETVTKQDGSRTESESIVTVQKDGTKQEQKTEKSTEADGSKTETTSTSVTSKDGTVKTEGTLSSTDSAGNASGTTEFTEEVKTEAGKTTTVRSESYKDADGNASGSKDLVTESSKATSGSSTTETVKAQETAKDADGNIVSERETTVEDTESSDGKSRYSSERVSKDGSVEITESSSAVSADGSLASKTDVSVKDGKVQKAESLTVVSSNGGELDTGIVRSAVEQSEASIEKTSVKADEVQKTLKVESSEGTGLTLSPEAMTIISGHGASLKVEGSVGSSKGSVTVDTDVCTSLSKDADGKIGLSMYEGKHDDLTEAQKATVKERYFIVLGATVGDKKVHELGGKAMVTFGYSLRDGQDASRLCIFYVADDGSRTRMDSTFDPEAGMFSMITDHFSVFMVGEIEDGNGNGTSMALVAGIAVVLIAGIVAVFLVMRSRMS